MKKINLNNWESIFKNLEYFDKYHPSRPGLKLHFEVAKVLSNYSFKGVALHHILNRSFEISYYQGHFFGKQPGLFQETLKTVFRPLYKFVKFRLLAKHQRVLVEKKLGNKGKAGIEVTSLQERARKNWEPIARELGEENCVLIFSNEKKYNESNLPYEHILLNWYYGLSPYFYFLSKIPSLILDFYKIKKDYKLNKNFFVFSISFFNEQLMNFYAAYYAGKKFPLLLYYTGYDKGSQGAFAVPGFQKASVKTFTGIHWAIGHSDLPFILPLTADRILAWGDYQKKMLKTNHVNESNVLVVGSCKAVQISEELDWYPYRYKKFNFEFNLPLVSIMLSGMHEEKWYTIVERIIEAVNDINLVCRLHPSNKQNKVESLSQLRAQNFKLVGAEDIPFDECLINSDLVIVDISNAGFDAILNSKNLVVFNHSNYNEDRGILNEIINEGLAQEISSINSLVEYLNYMRSFDYSTSMIEEFINRYLAYTGKESAKLTKNKFLN